MTSTSRPDPGLHTRHQVGLSGEGEKEEVEKEEVGREGRVVEVPVWREVLELQVPVSSVEKERSKSLLLQQRRACLGKVRCKCHLLPPLPVLWLLECI